MSIKSSTNVTNAEVGLSLLFCLCNQFLSNDTKLESMQTVSQCQSSYFLRCFSSCAGVCGYVR